MALIGWSNGKPVLTIGARVQHATSYQTSKVRKFEGWIDDIRMYNYALPSSEIRQLYENEKPDPKWYQ